MEPHLIGHIFDGTHLVVVNWSFQDFRDVLMLLSFIFTFAKSNNGTAPNCCYIRVMDGQAYRLNMLIKGDFLLKNQDSNISII